MSSPFKSLVPFVAKINEFFVMAFYTQLLIKNEIKGRQKLRTTQKHDLVTPYIAMEVTRDNNMLMKSPTFSHLMFKHL